MLLKGIVVAFFFFLNFSHQLRSTQYLVMELCFVGVETKKPLHGSSTKSITLIRTPRSLQLPFIKRAKSSSLASRAASLRSMNSQSLTSSIRWAFQRKRSLRCVEWVFLFIFRITYYFWRFVLMPAESGLHSDVQSLDSCLFGNGNQKHVFFPYFCFLFLSLFLL